MIMPEILHDMLEDCRYQVRVAQLRRHPYRSPAVPLHGSWSSHSMNTIQVMQVESVSVLPVLLLAAHCQSCSVCFRTSQRTLVLPSPSDYRLLLCTLVLLFLVWLQQNLHTHHRARRCCMRVTVYQLSNCASFSLVRGAHASRTSWFNHKPKKSSATNAACNKNSNVTYLVSC